MFPVTIELAAEELNELARRANAEGIAIHAYVAQRLRDLLGQDAPSGQASGQDATGAPEPVAEAGATRQNAATGLTEVYDTESQTWKAASPAQGGAAPPAQTPEHPDDGEERRDPATGLWVRYHADSGQWRAVQEEPATLGEVAPLAPGAPAGVEAPTTEPAPERTDDGSTPITPAEAPVDAPTEPTP